MKRRLIAGALLLSFSACTATIHRVNAPNIEGEIVGSDSDGLEVASDQGTTYRVPRESVGDIDHPGNVLAVMGAAAIVLGGLVAFTSRGPEQDQKSNLVPGLLVSSTGFGLLLGGMVPYSESRRASRPFAEARPPRLSLPAEGGWTAGPPPPLPAPPLLAPPPPAPEPQPPLFSDGLLVPPPPPPSDDLVAPPDEPPPPSPATIVPASDSSPSRSAAPAPAPFEKKKRPPVLFKPAPPAAPLPAGGG